MFDLKLPDLGPYAIDFTRNGRFLVLGGRRGHLAMLDALRMDVRMEVGPRSVVSGTDEKKRSLPCLRRRGWQGAWHVCLGSDAHFGARRPDAFCSRRFEALGREQEGTV